MNSVTSKVSTCELRDHLSDVLDRVRYAGERIGVTRNGEFAAVEGAVACTTREIVFPSPSTAGAVALGRSCNGRVEWVSPQGSFGAWETREVEDV